MKRFFLFFALMLAGTAQAEIHVLKPYQDGEAIPEGYGVVLMAFKASGHLQQICEIAISDRKGSNVFELTDHVNFGGPDSSGYKLFLLPEGQYFFKRTAASLQSITTEDHGEADSNHQNIDIHIRDQYFEIMEGAINYIGEWDMGPEIDVGLGQPPKIGLSYAQEPIVAAFNANPQLFNSAPIAVSELRKRARKLGR